MLLTSPTFTSFRSGGITQDLGKTYWTRSHAGPSYNISGDPHGTRFFIVSIATDSYPTWGPGDLDTTGVRPVVNLRADTMVTLQPNGRYKLIYD